MKKILLISLMFWPITGITGYQEGLDAYKGKDYTAALKELNPLAEQGNTDAQFVLGEMYADTKGTVWDNELSVRYYRKSANQGNARAAFKLGEIYELGIADLSDIENIGPNEKNHATSVQWFRKAAANGDAEIKLAVANKLHDDIVEANKSFALQLYKDLAATGTPQLQLELATGLSSDDAPETVAFVTQLFSKNIAHGSDELKLQAARFLLSNGSPKDKEVALHTLRGVESKDSLEAAQLLLSDGSPEDKVGALQAVRSLASKNNLEAETILGVSYLNGIGVKQDDLAAASYLKTASDQGYAQAQLELAGMYIRGQGMPVNFPEAITLLDKAVAQDYPGAKQARSDLAGQAVIKGDYSTAICEFRPRAEKGDARSQWWMAHMYEGGLGVEQSYDKAIQWYLKSSQGNDRAASFALGEIYSGGRGVPVDLNKAEKYFTLAAQQGHGEANEKLAGLKKIQTCAQNSSTLLFGEVLNCATKNSLRAAAKITGAKAIREDDHYYYDQYDSSQILDGTSDLYIGYFEGKFAKAFYQYDSKMDTEKVVEVRNMVASKYGKPISSKGNPSLGPVLYSWKLKDGIFVEVKRDWPDTTVTLSYIHQVNFAAMQAVQNKQKLAEESSKRNKQKQAF